MREMCDMKAYYLPSAIGMLTIAAGIAASTGCSAMASDEAEGSEAELSETAGALDDAARAELTRVGFTPAETKAVAESIAISKLLGVQSFVAEANDGHATADDSVRRESHG